MGADVVSHGHVPRIARRTLRISTLAGAWSHRKRAFETVRFAASEEPPHFESAQRCRSGERWLLSAASLPRSCENSPVPKLANVGPYRIFFYSNESGEPAHVHVRRERKLAKFWLEPVELADSKRFAAHELRGIEQIVQDNRAEFLEAWHEYFGS